MSEPVWLGIAGMAELISSKALSPVELVSAHLDRIEALNPALNAYISVYPEQALAAAREAEGEIAAGRYRGPLHGVPVAVKDLFEVEGMVRTCGSLMFSEPAGTQDADAVARLRKEGAIVLGMLNLHEFAFGPTGINPHFGSARNPWDTNRSCGGSSSGSGCAVAASLAAGALGTDTGGSVRLPASICGVVGLKPTHELVSQAGIYPLVGDFDTGGPLARSVRDIALMMDAIATRPGGGGGYGAGLGQPIAGVRVGVLGTPFFDDLHPGVAASVTEAIPVFESLGANVQPVELPWTAEGNSAWNVIALAAVYALHKERAEAADSKLSPDGRERMLRGKRFSADDVAEAQRQRTLLKADMAERMAEYDVLLAPTTPIPAVSADTGRIEIDGQAVEGAHVLGKFTRLASFTGQPAISLPCGFTDEGLPVGLQLIGRWNGEAELLRTAHAFEQATVWHERRPPTLD